MAVNALRTFAPWCVLLVLVAGCAQVGELTGGPKDEAPPRLLRSTPAQGATRFTGDRLLLEFDERVQLERVRDRLLVSPPLGEVPDVKLINARSVAVELRSPLLADRTYTFSIGEAIKDLTEGNQALGLDLVFSTGTTLDSLSIAGVVLDAFTGLPSKDVLVMAYPVAADSAFRTGRPAYATRSAADGSFTLKHLRDEAYAVRALLDKNTNYRYDLPSEPIAFHHAPMRATWADGTQAPVALFLFQEAATAQRIVDQRVEANGQWMLALALEARSVEVQDLARTGGILQWKPLWNARRDTVELWPSDTTALGDGMYRLVVDGIALDTLAYRPLQRMPFHTGLSLASDGEEAEPRLRATRPLLAIDSSRFLLRVDGLERTVPAALSGTDPQVLVVRTGQPEASQATLMILPKAVRDLYDGSNDTVRIALRRRGEKELGTVRIRLADDSASQGTRLVHLLDGSGKVLREARLEKGQTEVVWERLAPTSCALRVIVDRNGNGRWDTGALGEGRQPERVYTHDKPIQVRAAWDVRVDLPPLPPDIGRP
jgi:hypothetical protein